MAVPDLTIAFCTNIWNHYQGSLCTEFARLLGENRFNMCLFEAVHDERLQLGWPVDIPDCTWIAGPPRCADELERLTRIVCEADVAVLGACPDEVQAARVATGKLTFVTSERLWKKAFASWRMLNPRYARGVRRCKAIANRPNVHYLPIGAYATGDVRRIGAYGDRLWTWAYFAEIASNAPQARINQEPRILWVGRLLRWKRVDLLLKAVARVAREPALGGLDVVGCGPDKSRLLRLARRLDLEGKCVFHDPVPPNQARALMRQADIYVLPSDRHEGWGVVANEAMSEGAVLVANEQAGAARMLVDHGRTGFLFADGDVRGLAGILSSLLADSSLREAVRQAAWLEIQRLWHPRVGAERLLGLSQGLLGLAPMPRYTEGPCSGSTA